MLINSKTKKIVTFNRLDFYGGKSSGFSTRNEIIATNVGNKQKNEMRKIEKMKFTLIILALILTFSCELKAQKNHLKIICNELTKEKSEYSDLLRIKTCEFNNHLFKSIGKPDYKDRYSYNYELLQIGKTETTIIRNSDFFNDSGIELEKIINDKHE